jgi:hypothetical protein
MNIEAYPKEIQALLKRVRLAQPTAENVERLWKCYQHAYRDDNDLLMRTCSKDLGIDGLTENLSPDDIAECIRMPDCVVLEVEPLDSADQGGFVIVRYASREIASRDRFNAYFLENVFPQDVLRFRTNEDRVEFLKILEHGEVAYFAEFVSTRGRSATTALVLGAYQEVCIRRLGVASCPFVGKCLDSVQIGRCRNLKGNQPVKALAEKLGLEKIALCDQIRRLHLQERSVALSGALPELADASPPATIDAVLTFALYCGNTQTAVERMIHQP